MVEELKRKIKVLNETVWEHRASWPAVAAWLENFNGITAAEETERLHALHMLSQFMYFGARETRSMLRALFRDVYKYPIVEAIRRANGDTVDEVLIRGLFSRELLATRFLGIGNPAESGTYLLYFFRQENGLPKNLFINSSDIFMLDADGHLVIKDTSVRRYVFVDDLCGSGQLAEEYSRDIVSAINRLDPSVEVSYYVLFATTNALNTIKANTAFSNVNCVFDLDPSFQCFSADSRYFANTPDGISKPTAQEICLSYGLKLWPEHPLGYRGSEFLIGFHHNTPDNTLPVIWYEESGSNWVPIFKRYPKFAW